jgi:multidrug efflux system outer membrane protein
MFEPKKTPLAILAAVALLSACTRPAGHQDSGIEVSSSWRSLLAGSGAPVADLNAPLVAAPTAEVEQAWWHNFDDPVLDALIAEGLANNKTLQIAKARVEEARAGRGVAQARLLPEVNALGSVQRGNQGFLTNDKAVSIGDVDLQATWELDLFGRNQARVAEAAAILESEEATSQGVRVGLLADIARSYFDLRNAQRQIDLTRQNLETEKRTLELIHAQLQGALASDFDVQRAGAQVSATEALIPALQTTHDAALNRLNVLLGHPPGSRDGFLEPPRDLRSLDPQILIAAPAKVLATRPDVRAAERRFAASLSAKDAATAELFPDISLTALFGAQSATPFSSNPWNLGAGLLQPILNFGRIEAQIDAADARQTQAFMSYQKTVLEALENMENALSGYGHEAGRNASLTTGVAQNRRAAELAQQQYVSGYTGLLDVLVAQRNLLDAEAAKAASDVNLRRDLVDIYAAAGGGWRDEGAARSSLAAATDR